MERWQIRFGAAVDDEGPGFPEHSAFRVMHIAEAHALSLLAPSNRRLAFPADWLAARGPVQGADAYTMVRGAPPARAPEGPRRFALTGQALG